METPEKNMKTVQLIKTPELRQWCLLGVFIVNFEQFSQFIPLFAFLTLNKLILDESTL